MAGLPICRNWIRMASNYEEEFEEAWQELKQDLDQIHENKSRVKDYKPIGSIWL